MQNKSLNPNKFGQFFSFAFILFLGLLILSGCEGETCGDGIVYDSMTKLPLDSVLCISNGSDRIYTDSLGQYYLCGPFGTCMGGCPDVVIEFSKNGFKSQKVTNPNKSAIYMEKE